MTRRRVKATATAVSRFFAVKVLFFEQWRLQGILIVCGLNQGWLHFILCWLIKQHLWLVRLRSVYDWRFNGELSVLFLSRHNGFLLLLDKLLIRWIADHLALLLQRSTTLWGISFTIGLWVLTLCTGFGLFLLSLFSLDAIFVALCYIADISMQTLGVLDNLWSLRKPHRIF